MIRVTWTLRSQPASAQTCADAADLEITFFGDAEPFGFSQVSCIAGVFTVDKLPSVYTKVGLGRTGEPPVVGDFDAAGNAAIDLP